MDNNGINNEINRIELSDDEIAMVSGGRDVGSCFEYTIQRGDTLTRIAARYDTTVNILVKINHIKDKNKIRAGDILLIPTPKN